MKRNRRTLEPIRRLATLMVVSLPLLIGCNMCLKRSRVPNELVMREGARIEAKTKGGELAIIAGNKNRRRYEWDGCGLTAHPCPRSERWYGSLGILDPAPGISYLLNSCHGVSRP